MWSPRGEPVVEVDVIRVVEIEGLPGGALAAGVSGQGRARMSQGWKAVTGGTPILLPEMGPLAGKGVVERMRSIGVTVETWVEIPWPARATQEQASLLGLSAGDLVLSIERTYYDGDGRPVETADIIVPDRSWEVAYEFAVDPPEPD
jgi:GntR family transcriptional regulator